MSLFKSRNLFLVLAFCLALALVVLAYVRYEPADQIELIARSLPEGVSLALEEIDYTHIEGGVARWHLVAERAERRASDQKIAILDPDLTFYDEQGEFSGSMRAVAGELNNDYSGVTVWEKVVVENAAGYTLQTDQLTYDHQERVIHTDADVQFVSADVQLRGRGMKLDLESHDLTLFADVHAVLSRNDAKE